MHSFYIVHRREKENGCRRELDVFGSFSLAHSPSYLSLSLGYQRWRTGSLPFASLNTKCIIRRVDGRRNSTVSSNHANSHRSATCHGHLAGYSKSLRRRWGRKDISAARMPGVNAHCCEQTRKSNLSIKEALLENGRRRIFFFRLNISFFDDL